MARFFGRGAGHVPAARGAAPRTEDEVRQILRLLPRYRVLLYNDDHNAMDDVVLALVRTIAGMEMEQAVRIMLEAHTTGCAQVIICLKELAEHYREGLESYGLTSTIEPA